MKKWLFLALITLPLAGCGTLSTLDQSKPYSGIQQDMELMEPCKNVGCAGLVILTPLAIIDFPFSFVGDTLMLPIKGIQNLVQDQALQCCEHVGDALLRCIDKREQIDKLEAY